MARKRISAREKRRRHEQSRKQWEKDNPNVAAALKAMLEQPPRPYGWIEVNQLRYYGAY